MKMPKRARQLSISGASIAAPVAIVLAMRVVFGGGPSAAPAATLTDPAAAVDAAAGAPEAGGLSPEQKKALAWLSGRAIAADLASPMDHPPAATRIAVVEKPPEPAAPVKTTPVAPLVVKPVRPAGELTLTLISASADGTFGAAVINGTSYQLGQEVEKGWTITKLDSRKGAVTLTGPGGVTFELLQAGRK